jgi:D-glycero-D-manno-heptose 1,7-bisphosphate phosphatase
MISGKISRLNMKNKRKAIFLDRDGVINKFIPDIHQISDFELIPGAAEAIQQINKSEYLAIIVTNKPAIAKGWMTKEDLQNMHDKMDTLLGEKSAYIDALYYCPHHPHKGFPGEIPALKINCKCRKPKPGMLFQAAKDLNIDLKNSWIVGDSYQDIQAGVRAGCQTIAIGTIMPGAKTVTKNLADAIKFIMKDKS